MKISSRVLVACVAGAVALTGCSSYDRAEFIDEMQTDIGISEQVATCIADGMEAEIGVDRMGARGNPTAEEEEIATQVAIDCVMAG